MVITLHPQDPEPRKVRMLAERLLEGAVIICPTDTVHAYVCSAQRPKAIEDVARLKGVKPEKAELSLLCADLAQAMAFSKPLDTPTFRLLKRALPGPYTFILPASGAVPSLFKSKKRTVGIRVPAHPVPKALLAQLGHPLVAASVHDPDAVLDYTADPERIDEHLGHQVECVIDAGVGGIQASTVIDLCGPGPVIIREGAGDTSILH